MTGMGEAVQLVSDSRHHPRVTVAGIHHRYTGGKVNIAAADEDHAQMSEGLLTPRL